MTYLNKFVNRTIYKFNSSIYTVISMSALLHRRISINSIIIPISVVFPIFIVVTLLIVAVGIYLLLLVIKALKKYVKSEKVRTEKKEIKISLGEVIKKHREEFHMTQEFVAETIGVSRQAVSKWESGKSDPSTSNLMALADLFEIPAEELLKAIAQLLNISIDNLLDDGSKLDLL